MARRRKHRTHVRQPANVPDGRKIPKSFIIKHGQVGVSLAQLVCDLRKVMEPNTASRLKERHRNKLKDYLTIAPALQVTHLLALTLTPMAPSLRIIKLSSGPTLTFRIERYSLIKNILNSKKRARSVGLEYLTPPLLVLASFPPPSQTTPPHLTLLMKTFQSLFPPLSPQTLSLSSARRVVLIQYNAGNDTIDFRHYLITVKPYGVSRRVRKILEGSQQSKTASGLLDLGREKDVADFLLRQKGEPGPDDAGYESATSAASSAGGDEADTVSLADNYVGRNNKRGQKKAVRLDEIGPRIEMRLVKITEDVPGKDGAVLYHKFVKKSRAEVAQQKKAHAEKARLKQQRREEQEQNIARKKALKEMGKEAAGAVEDGEDQEEDTEDDAEDDEGEWDEEEDISEGDASDLGAEESNSVSESDEEPPPDRPKRRGKYKER